MAHRLITRALSVPGASVHWYDKPETPPVGIIMRTRFSETGGMVASLTPLPVIGVPVRATRLDGVDSLLSIVQMPRGVPVATVALNNSTSAALLAIRMLGISDTDLVSGMSQYQEDMREENMVKGEKLEQEGVVPV
ncbi:hypothetical protein Bca4012_035484 [Brassica carinata]|uniref:phosphoribosylaminoimidazole carboxylase n=1 Tax=Brassica carinata TaxID=52824 RepID=A0A8X7WBF8_BRACI|nr:hypothetical protein Bca52824_009259 [Brassica carinata]